MDLRLSVCGVAFREQKVFLAKRKPGGTQGGRWEFPGGKAENGEDPKTALVREWDEELGIQVRTGTLLAQALFTNKENQYLLEAYEVSFSQDPETSSEHETLGWFTLDQAKNLDLSDSDRKILNQLVIK